MNKVFIDTDVIIDFLLDRKPFSEGAVILFDRIEKKEIEGFTSAQSIGNLYYILRKLGSQKKVVGTLKELTTLIGVLPVDQPIVGKALESGFTDLEDAIQYYCAEAAGMDALITRNHKDYRLARIPVLGPDPGNFIIEL